MVSRKPPVDNVRASRDGHEYHEAWTARKALQLLCPDSDLAGIAVEGLSPTDQTHVSAQTVQISDITLYYGGQSSFGKASRVSIAQFKYSVSDKDSEFRASNARKTIEKFSIAYRDYKKKYGARAVHDKLDFQITTNQPIYEALLHAIDGIACRLPLAGEARKQADQFAVAAGLDGRALAVFASKCKLTGGSGSLGSIKSNLASLLVDWSATGDSLAAARLGQLRNLVREKAGTAGDGRNLITRTDILATLEIGDAKDLLPCEPALVDVGAVLERQQLGDAIALIPVLSAPLLVHAAGGVGKTVFMDSLATKIRSHHEIVFFDCFGGGAYRSPGDARHLARRGLIQIANTLAFRGLCDPILPGSPTPEKLYRTFRRRLLQCVETLSRMAPGRTLVLFLDAIDNADIEARQRSDEAFPVKLLEMLHTEPVPGVKLVVSCRTERKPDLYAKYEDFELRPFSVHETASFLCVRLDNVSQMEINVAQARSGGNARVLEYLVTSSRGLLDESEIDRKLELDDLIQKRITKALETAIERGSEQSQIGAFLASLAVLPPPVPLDEYAGATGIETGAIESFASDLTPLLERSNQGLMFRDEPTETLVRNRYTSSRNFLRRVAKNLFARQSISVYAARSLPGLLHELDDGKRLFTLAFDDRLPPAITSTVGKQDIRYARLRAATLHAAINKNYNYLVRLLLEISTIAAVDHRGIDYILDHPDLVVAAKDVDSMRRLFENRTGWPGRRHARLSIAYTLSGENEEASRHAVAASEWINHHRRKEYDDKIEQSGPELPDIAAIPFHLICQGRGKDAARYMKNWRDWYSYEICEFVFDYVQLMEAIRTQPPGLLGSFIAGLEGLGPLTAALSFRDLPRKKIREITAKVAGLCKTSAARQLSKSYKWNEYHPIQNGLRKAATVAMSLGLNAEALTISFRAPHRRPAISSFNDGFFQDNVFSFIFRIALVAAAKGTTLHEKDVLPEELVRICSRINKNLTGAPFRNAAKKRLTNRVRRKSNDYEQVERFQLLSLETRQDAERFIDYRLEPLLSLADTFSNVLTAPRGRVDRAFAELLKVWVDARNNGDPYRDDKCDRVFSVLGLNLALFIVEARSELKPASIKRFLATVHGQGIHTHHLIQVIAILARRQPLKGVAGEQAVKARALIEADDDVTSRASQLGALGRAMLPASIDEASVYFSYGLEQMDAIGSGDNQFTNELLLFTSSTKGRELRERDFHTLTNICELNLGGEAEKFPSGVFGRALSKTAGPRGLAKLSRWDDRSKISLSNTLLPFLLALVEEGKMDPKDALALNRLARPVEYFFASSAEFAHVIRSRVGPNPEVITELIQQFLDDNPDTAVDGTVETLVSLAKEALESSSDAARCIRAARGRYAMVSKVRSEVSNYCGTAHTRLPRPKTIADRNNHTSIHGIVTFINPVDKASLERAIDDFNGLKNRNDLKGTSKNSPFSGVVDLESG